MTLKEKLLAAKSGGAIFAIPKKMMSQRLILKEGSVVQLVRMPPCHGGGRGFESRPVRKRKEVVPAQIGTRCAKNNRVFSTFTRLTLEQN